MATAASRSAAEAADLELSRKWQVVAVVTIWAIAIPLACVMYRTPALYNGPPITLDFGAFNPRGDRMFLQGSDHYDKTKPVAGLHPVVVWSEHYHSLILCEDVFHDFYANEDDAKAGILEDPARYSQVHPKMGRRGCWHMLGLVK